MNFKKIKLALILLFFVFSDLTGADLLEVSTDHFSRMIISGDTATFSVQVLTEGQIEDNVQVVIRSLSSSSDLFIEPGTIFTNTPTPFELKTSSETTGEFILEIKAMVDDQETTHYVRLRVIEDPGSNPVLDLAFPPSGELSEAGPKIDKFVPQTIEGAIVPVQTGSIEVHLISPGLIKDTIRTVLDSEGLFHVNPIFNEHGPWEAFAVWNSDATTDTSDTIQAEVKPRPVRLTVTIDDFHHSADVDILNIVGQIATDFLNETEIVLEVMDPDSQEIPVTFDSLDSTTGKFSATFAKRDTGIYTITATASYSPTYRGSLNYFSEETQYASLAPMRVPPMSVKTIISKVKKVPISDIPVGYAVLVVGYSDQYYGHLSMASYLRDILIHRRGFRPEDILLVTLINNVQSFELPINPVSSDATAGDIAITDTIRGFLKKHLKDRIRKFHRGLVFYWIGQADQDGNFKVGESAIRADSIRNIYKSAVNEVSGPDTTLLLQDYDGIVFIHAGDNSGKLLKSIEIESLFPEPIENKHSISSLFIPDNTDLDYYQEDFKTECGEFTFSKWFIDEIAQDSTVHDAFKKGWRETTIKTPTDTFYSEINPKIEPDQFLTFNQIDPSNFWHGRDTIRLGYDVGTGELEALLGEPIITSIVNGLQFDQETVVYQPIDNPNRYPMRQITLHVKPPANSMQTPQCFKMQPIDSTSLWWSGRIPLFRSKGIYRINTVAEVDDPQRGHINVPTASINIVSHVEPEQEITVNPASHDFGDVRLDASATRVFVVTNATTNKRLLIAAELLGDSLKNFHLISGKGLFPLEPGNSLEIEVSFNPTSEGPKSDTLRIMNTTSEIPVDVFLTGNGVSPPPCKIFYPVLEAGIQYVFQSMTTRNEEKIRVNFTGPMLSVNFLNSWNCKYRFLSFGVGTDFEFQRLTLCFMPVSVRFRLAKLPNLWLSGGIGLEDINSGINEIYFLSLKSSIFSFLKNNKKK